VQRVPGRARRADASPRGGLAAVRAAATLAPLRRLLPLLLVFVLASTAAAATVRGTKQPDLLQTAFTSSDTVSCGRGVDIVSADAADKVAADCETVSRRLSVDPYANRDSQHETAVEPDDFAYGDMVVAAFQVGRRESGAAANIGTAVSTDGGRMWRRSLLPAVTVNAGGTQTAASDPAVAYDAVHATWLVSTLTIEPNSSHVYVARSPDGLHWSAPVDVADGPVLDKEWVACDNNVSSPYHGRCYAEYTDDDRNSTISQSSDDGGVTWSAPVRIGAFSVGTQPAIRPDGSLTVVSAGGFANDEALMGTIVAFRSVDGGATWQRSNVADLRAASNEPMRAISLPSVDADSNGTIYAAWADCRFRPTCNANDIVLSTSTDGVVWTSPARVTTGPSSFIPGLAADPAAPGHLAVVYALFDAKGNLGIAVTQSADGRKWAPRQRLNALPIKMTWLPRAGGRMVGDYFSVAFAGGRVVPVYALAAAPLKGRFREGIFAASLKPLGQRR